MADQSVTLNGWKGVLKKYGKSSAAHVADNPKLAAATFDVLRGIAERNFCDAAADATGVANELSGKLKISATSKTTLKTTSFLVSEAKLTMGLRVLARAGEESRLASPGGAVALIGATMVTKTGLALGLAGDDAEKARCIGALMEVAGNVGVTAITWETGVGAMIGLASIAASSWSAYGECRNVTF